MDTVIVYPTPDGGVAIVTPATFSGLTVDEIAVKDVPPNTPYRIIPVSDIPSDRTFRDAWEYVP